MEVRNILYKLRCPGGITKDNLSDYGTIRNILDDYKIPSKDVLEILTRLIDIDNFDTKYIDNLEDLNLHDNDNNMISLSQSCSIGRISSHYDIIFDNKAYLVNPDNKIIRRLSLVLSSGIVDKYEIVFLEQEENDSFRNFGVDYIISSSRMHKKKTFDDILHWLSECIEIDISIDEA